MNTELLFRIFFSLIASLSIGFMIYNAFDKEQNGTEKNIERYSPYISGQLLPIIFVTLLIFSLIFNDMINIKQILALIFNIFVSITFYFTILLLIMPFLRKKIDPRTCALMWLLPNFLFLTFYQFMELNKPLLIIKLPNKVLNILIIIWFIGFISILLFNTISHLIFRHKLLKNSTLVTDYKVLNILNKEIEDARIQKPKFKLVTCQQISTPMTIGLFKRSMRILLPNKSYTEEELSLIFRHEIIHISREDSWSKFFLVFCTSICWFNPLMWIAMQKSADDFELSCDQTVLLNEDEVKRLKYANLILSSAGNETGYTTCLSASAKALKYRLKNILKTNKKTSGAIFIVIIMFSILMTSGYICLSYDEFNGKDIIFYSEEINKFHISHINKPNSEYHNEINDFNHEKLLEYLYNLKLSKLTGNYTFSDNENEIILLLETPKGRIAIDIQDDTLKITPLYGKLKSSLYYVPDGIDWDYIKTIIYEYPALNIKVKEKNNEYLKTNHATLYEVIKIQDGIEENIYKSNEETGGSYYGSHSLDITKKAKFDFSHRPDKVIVNIEEINKKSEYTEEFDNYMDNPIFFEIPKEGCIFTIKAFYNYESSIYEFVYKYIIEININ